MASYHAIDRDAVGEVTQTDLGHYLRAHGKNYSDLELISIIRRIDMEGDAKITLDEWAEFLKL